MYKVLPIILIFIFIISCSSQDTDTDIDISETQDSDQSETQDSDQIETSLITMEDRTFSIDDFISIGWKKSKQLDNGEFDNTESIWYGFFDKKDVEVWIYNSHDTALTNGAPYAEKATSKRGMDNTKGGRVRYNSYAIAGNAMIVCENNLDECKALVSALE